MHCNHSAINSLMRMFFLITCIFIFLVILFAGVICAMEGALDFLELGTLAGKTIAIQGAGNVCKLFLIVMFVIFVSTVIENSIDFSQDFNILVIRTNASFNHCIK